MRFRVRVRVRVRARIRVRVRVRVGQTRHLQLCIALSVIWPCQPHHPTHDITSQVFALGQGQS